MEWQFTLNKSCIHETTPGWALTRSFVLLLVSLLANCSLWCCFYKVLTRQSIIIISFNFSIKNYDSPPYVGYFFVDILLYYQSGIISCGHTPLFLSQPHGGKAGVCYLQIPHQGSCHLVTDNSAILKEESRDSHLGRIGLMQKCACRGCSCGWCPARLYDSSWSWVFLGLQVSIPQQLTYGQIRDLGLLN